MPTSSDTPVTCRAGHGPPARRAASWRAAAICVAAWLAGCSTPPEPPPPPPRLEVAVTVTSREDTNGGRPFYAVVRAVDQGAHFTDSYELIAGKVFASPADPSVLATEVIYPGVPAVVTVRRPEGTSLGLYFLFTSPGERWKVLKPQPLGDRFSVGLGVDTVVTLD